VKIFFFVIRFSWFFLQTSKKQLKIILGKIPRAKPSSRNELVSGALGIRATYG
jgi:hypothetical protein